MFVISSCIRTVLPTPAPPNRPILPPFKYGANKSTTFIPVSSISAVGCNSSNSGAGLCIGICGASVGAGLPSTGCPNTLNILPNVASPTGTVIGAPVSTTSIPLTSPSVELIDIHLTVSPPTCCATSATISLSPCFITNAFNRLGKLFSLSNLTSNTGPIT